MADSFSTGSGDQLYYYTPLVDRITHIYFVEPNTSMHNKLREKASKTGLNGKYTIITAGAEDLVAELGKHGVLPGTVNAIVSILCLCGVPAVESKVVGVLYKMLASGGQLVIWEHVLNRDSVVARGYQRLLQFSWPHLVGGCSLMEKTDEYLRNAGNWKSVDLKRPKADPLASPIPYVFGTLVKA
jgi:hypothetical protein